MAEQLTSFSGRMCCVFLVAVLLSALPAGAQLPAGWVSQDIGSPGLAGGGAYSNGAYSVTGGGSDIWGMSDQFRFVYHPVRGDFNVTARVAGFAGGVNTWRKAGVMARATTNANARHAMTLLSAEMGVRFQYRATDGSAAATGVASETNTAPHYVRLTRHGNDFAAYTSADGMTWTNRGSVQTIVMPDTILIGLAVTAHDNNALTTATFDNVRGCEVDNGTGPSRITETTADVDGNLWITPGTTHVWLCYGTADGNTNAAAWQHVVPMGVRPVGSLATNLAGLTPGDTYYYRFLASNAAWRAWSYTGSVFETTGPPAVSLAGASPSIGRATLKGMLDDGARADIYVCWGPSDGGTNLAGWAHVQARTNRAEGAFSVLTSDAVPAYAGVAYRYRCCASNSQGVAWTAVEPFTVIHPGGATIGLLGSFFTNVPRDNVALDLDDAAYAADYERVWRGTKPGSLLARSEVPAYNTVVVGALDGYGIFAGLTPGDDCAAAFSGTFNPSIGGTYAFRWACDDRGMMYLDGDDDGKFQAAEGLIADPAWNGVGSVVLDAGRSYNVIFMAQEYGGNETINLWYTPPGGTETLVDTSVPAGLWRHPSDLGSIQLTNMPAASVTATTAELRARLGVEGAVADVSVYWGSSNGGTNGSAWEHSAYVGSYTDVTDVTVAYGVSGLPTGANTFYAFRATNAVDDVWKTAGVDVLLTAPVTLSVVDADGAETGPDDGLLAVTRSAAVTNADLTVFYSVEPASTADVGIDVEDLSGWVVIPAGATQAFVRVAVIDDRIPGEGNETLSLRLAAGGYMPGTPDRGTVTIADNDPSLEGWTHKMRIAFDAYDREAALNDFPLLVVLNDGRAPFRYADMAAPVTGGDLRFADATETRLLPYEVESWDAGGDSCVWVRMPSLARTNRFLWAYWGNAAETNPPAYAEHGAVWPAYEMVWHMTETNAIDATVNGHDGMSTGNVNTAGIVAGAQAFNNAQVMVTDTGVDIRNRSFTVSAWARRAAAGQDDFFCGQGAPGDMLHIGFRANNQFAFAFYGDDLNADGPWTDTVNWHHWVCVYDSGPLQQRVYRDGVLIGTRTAGNHLTMTGPFVVGARGDYSYLFGGELDELRLSNVARSEDWAYASWLSQASNGTAVAYGSAVESLPVSGLTSNAAVLNGRYWSDDGGWPTTVRVYYGTADGGTNAGAWDAHLTLGAAAPGIVLSTNVSLAVDQAYFYRFYASNAVRQAWAVTPAVFMTGRLTIRATDPVAAEPGVDTATFTVSRPAGCTAIPLTVRYAVDPASTATAGVDFALLPGIVEFSAGAETTSIAVIPLDDRLYEDRETVAVALVAGTNYLIGAPAWDEATIRDDEPGIERGWTHRMKIRFGGYTGTETLTNFPALVVFNAHRPAFDYAAFASATGGDLRFADADETLALNFEVEQWNPLGDSFVWVQVPELSGSNDFVWAYWGNPDNIYLPASATNGAVWNDAFRGVWHMQEADGMGLVPDATARGNDGDNYGTTNVAGQIALGRDFENAAGNYVEIENESDFDMQWDMSVSCWFRIESLATEWQAMVAKGEGYNWRLHRNATTPQVNFVAGNYNDGGAATSTTAVDDGLWHHVYAVRAGTNLAIYMDGALEGTSSETNGIVLNNLRVTIGDNAGRRGRYFDGMMDEVRVESAGRSSNWVWTCYQNQRAESDLLTYYPAEDYGRQGTLLMLR